MSHYYHYCSKGFESEVLFCSPEEYIAGMNRVAICLVLSGRHGRAVIVVCYCLMDNHVHLILHGTKENCDAFMEDYKRLTGIWVKQHRKERLHERILFNGYLIKDKSSLKEKVAYVLRNPVAAGLDIVPTAYPWGTGMLMFTDNSHSTATAKRIEDISIRKCRELFDTRIKLPDDWLVLPDGRIWPGCYTKYSAAMNPFASVRDFVYTLNDRKIDKAVEYEMWGRSVSIPDGEVMDKAKDLVVCMFGKQSIRSCSAEERLAIARVLKGELSCGAKQLSRITGLIREDLEKLV